MAERHEHSHEEMWRRLLTGTDPALHRIRRWHKLLPHNPRCKICGAPFAGLGGMVLRARGRGPSSKNPHFCNACEITARTHPGGAEVELSMLFADVRGSTTLAERMSAGAFTQLMNRFYREANRVLIESDAMVDKLVGDEVIGLYLPSMGAHAMKAVAAAQNLLRVTGHADLTGPWVPVGVGVHTGVAYVGAVGSTETVTDFTALGDAVNVAARLAKVAGPGEILISDRAYELAGVNLDVMEKRRLKLKGRTEPIEVRVLRISPAAVPA